MSASDVAYFVADNGSGAELWRTDGTAAGTFALSGPGGGAATVLNGVVYFTTADGSGIFGPLDEMWQTDGTVAGTFAFGTSYFGTVYGVVGGHTLYLGSDDNQQHREGLYASTGGAQGQFLTAFGQSSGQGFNVQFAGIVGNEALFFVGNSLWESDGTVAGTHVVNLASIPSGDGLASVGPKLFFLAPAAGSQSNQLVETDGASFTAVTDPAIVGAGVNGQFWALNGELVIATVNGELRGWDEVSTSSTPIATGTSWQAVVGGRLYFEAADPRGSGFGDAVWVTDGTAAGTRAVADGDFTPIQNNLNRGMAVVGSRLVLYGSGPQGSGIYVSDGAVGSTVKVASVTVATNFVVVGDQAFFTVDNNDLWVSNGTVGGTHLVKHFTALVSAVAPAGGEVVFSASTDTSGQGRELWISDGTAAGTHLVEQLHPSQPGALAVTNAVAFGSGVAFVGTQQSTGALLWTSDGTLAGTAALPQVAQPFTDVGVRSGPIVVGDTLFFSAGNILGIFAATSGGAAPIAVPMGDRFFTPYLGKLFSAFGGNGFGVSDGTVAGTTQDLNYQVVAQPGVLGGKVLFLGHDFNGHTGLFATDGTDANTTFIAAVPESVTPGGITVSGAHGYFVATDPASGAELWVTDGTAGGTHLLSDIAPGAAGSATGNITAFNGGVVFDATDLTHGNQLWFSDGTAGGTFQLAINRTHDATQSLAMDFTQAFAFGGKTWFLANDNIHGEQLFSTDGTAAGTTAVATLDPNAQVPVGNFNFGSPPQAFVSLSGGKFLFMSEGNAWVSDGTTAGTSQLSAGFNQVQATFGVDGLGFFVASPTGVGRTDLWVTDGTAGGTHDIAGLNGFSPYYSVQGDDVFYFSSDPTDGFGLFAYNAISRTSTFLGAIPTNDAYFTDVGGQLKAGSAQSAAGAHVWVTDGTAAGTHMVGQASTVFYSDFTTLGGKGYFDDFGSTPGLWVTDGTAGGTHEVVTNLQIQSQSVTPIGSELYFIATQSNVTTVWAYNPATGNAAPVSAGNVNSIPFDFVAVGSGGFFVADDHTSSGELWHINAAGQVSEVTSPANGEVLPGNTGVAKFAVMGSSLFFTANDTTHGQSLFISDGTSATFLAQVAGADDFTVIGNKLYFQGSDTADGAELWVSDGTPGGTHRVTDTEASGNANAGDFVAVGAELFFSANDGVHGQELWMFNGQPGGAAMVADIDPGAAGSNPTGLTAMGGDAFFIANAGSGSQLWRSDGTAGGTVAITTAANGAGPQGLTLDGSELFFFGTDTAHGAGLFASDGTAGGTHFVAAFSAIADMTANGGKVFFQGTTAAGTELWSSDGTAGGTLKLSSTGFDPGSNPSGFVSAGGPASPTATSVRDFNDDGASDILFAQSSGALATWQMSGPAIVGGGGIGAPGGTWHAVATGDFNDDDHADILFADSAGNLATWQMNGTAIAGGGQVGNPGGTWAVKGIGDFNGDGASDILFQDATGNVATWQMYGTTVAGGGQIGNPGGTWSVAGVGDFDGDGRSDILFQDASGNLAIWEMLGTAIAGGGNIGNPAGTWAVKGVGDFNGDGMSDILFGDAGGNYAIWEMNGTSIIGGGAIGNPGGAWHFAAVGDYNGDGHADILFTDAAGDVAVWEMNGTSIVGGGNIGNPGAVWHVLG